MATAYYKILGQLGSDSYYGNGTSAALTANTNTVLYQVPASTSTIISTVTICNQTSVAQTFSVAVKEAGTTVSARNYIAYNTPIAANDTITLTLGITLTNGGTGDSVVVAGSSASMSFHVYGTQMQ
jgi:hypothetical protein